MVCIPPIVLILNFRLVTSLIITQLSSGTFYAKQQQGKHAKYVPAFIVLFNDN